MRVQPVSGCVCLSGRSAVKHASHKANVPAPARRRGEAQRCAAPETQHAERRVERRAAVTEPLEAGTSARPERVKPGGVLEGAMAWGTLRDEAARRGPPLRQRGAQARGCGGTTAYDTSGAAKQGLPWCSSTALGETGALGCDRCGTKPASQGARPTRCCALQRPLEEEHSGPGPEVPHLLSGPLGVRLVGQAGPPVRRRRPPQRRPRLRAPWSSSALSRRAPSQAVPAQRAVLLRDLGRPGAGLCAGGGRGAGVPDLQLRGRCGAARRGCCGAPDAAGAGGVTRAPARRAGIVGLQAAVDAGPGAVAGVQLLDVSLRMLHVTKQAPWQRPLVAALQLLLRDTPLGTWFFSSVARPQARARAPAGARQRQGRRGPASARVLARRR